VNLKMGSHKFTDVSIPLLWGSRAVVQDREEHLSIIDLAGPKTHLEILADKPAPKTRFAPTIEGFTILSRAGDEVYTYSAHDKLLISISLGLPDCQIRSDAITVGTNRFSGNMIVGAAVGIAVTSTGIAMGAPLPPDLAALVL
jgi:hypothetical protein